MLSPGKPGMNFLKKHKENTGSNIIENIQYMHIFTHDVIKFAATVLEGKMWTFTLQVI
jgi:hypothetical protein